MNAEMGHLWHIAGVALLSTSLVLGELYTPKHEAGRCAIRGSCGKGGFFSPKLPCLDNGLAEEPEAKVREQLVEICGSKWSTGPVCCEADQVRALQRAGCVCLTFCRLKLYHRTSQPPKTSLLHVRHARRTSTTSSAHSPVPPISPFSSM